MFHYLVTIILGIFIAILIHKPHWMLAYTLLVIMQTFTVILIAIYLYPTKWMTEECHKADHERYLARVGRMRVDAGQQEVLIQQQ
jgi:hypothetical protein